MGQPLEPVKHQLEDGSWVLGPYGKKAFFWHLIRDDRDKVPEVVVELVFQRHGRQEYIYFSEASRRLHLDMLGALIRLRSADPDPYRPDPPRPVILEATKLLRVDHSPEEIRSFLQCSAHEAMKLYREIYENHTPLRG